MNIHRKPTFLCIGSQKGGTTSLINYMNQHPEIFMVSKECHFFDTTALTKNNIKQYESQFTQTDMNKTIIGEKTPSYCYLRFAIDRIYDYNPDIKLLLILREPVSRAYSQYNMDHLKTLDSFLSDILLQQQKDNLSTIKSNGEYTLVRGFYDEQLEYIYSKFPKQNVYVGISEEIQKNKHVEYNKIFRLLGAKKDININSNKDTHVRKYEKRLSPEAANVLYNIYKPHNEKLYQLLGRTIDVWENYYKTL